MGTEKLDRKQLKDRNAWDKDLGSEHWSAILKIYPQNMLSYSKVLKFELKQLNQKDHILEPLPFTYCQFAY